MTAPLVVLAVLSFVGGWVGIPHVIGDKIGVHNYFEQALEPVIAHHSAPTAAPHADFKMLSPEPQPHDGAAPVQIVKTAFAGGGEAKDGGHGDATTEILLMVFSVLLAGAGMFAAKGVFTKEPLKKMPQILEDKWRVDELYDATIINPITKASRTGLWQWFDLGVIDGIVNGIGKVLSWIGGGARYLQGGFVRNYAAFILLGSLFVVGYFICQFLPLLGR
jgi:NADH-quinone oxidoreductase subunit L